MQVVTASTNKNFSEEISEISSFTSNDKQEDL